MPATPPVPLSYDIFVSDGPQRAGEERMPDGSPLMWSPLSSTLISGAQDAVLVDPPFTRTQIQRVGDWVERSGRRLAPQSALAEADAVLARGSTFTERTSP